MTNYLINGGIVAFIYFLIVFLRGKYIVKKEKPIKELVTDSVIVLFCAMLGEFAIGKMDNGILKSSTPTAFLGKPEF